MGGPLDAVKPWQTNQVAGVVRFQNKVYNLVQQYVSDTAEKEDADDKEEEEEMDDTTKKLLHKTMKKVTNDIESLSFNTAISALMVLTNHLQSLQKTTNTNQKVTKEAIQTLILMIAPFAPHLGEEC